MKRAIVTGASGFIGANLARRLLSDGHQVHALVRKGSDLWRLRQIQNNLHLHEVELGDQKRLEKVANGIRAEWIFHLAAHGAYSWQNEIDSILQTNIIGTANLVRACLKRGFEVFVNTGSSSEYGIKSHAPSETEAVDPNSYYALTKASATMFCRYASISNKVNITTLRLYSVYGPYEEPARFIPQLIVKGMQGKLPPLVNKRVCRDFIYIDDVIDAYMTIANRKAREFGAVYNVGTGKMTSIGQAVITAKEILKIKDKPQWQSMANRSWDADIWLANIKKIQNDFGWKSKYSFKDGLKEAIRWLNDNPRILEYYNKRRG